MSGSELLLYGGIGCAGLAAVMGAIAAVWLRLAGKKLRKQLEEEYGKRLKR